MIVCRICLEPSDTPVAYHPRCLKELFGTHTLPTLDIDTARLHTAALSMVGRTSLSGVQKKISLGLSKEREVLTVVAEGSQYILKPQTGVFPWIPENEHVTTRLAKLVGIETAQSGLIELTDGQLAFIARRFDRLPSGRKVRQEDFCQLSEKPPRAKYSSSSEQCVRLVKQYASEPLIELMKLYRLLVFCWWTGNGDMHLKNFSLLTAEDGMVRLTPAYDLVSTHLVIRDDPLALPVGGRRIGLTRGAWRGFADYCGLPPKVSERLLDEQIKATDEAVRVIGRSFLPVEQKGDYEALVRARSESIHRT